jgi:hypothetical protein
MLLLNVEIGQLYKKIGDSRVFNRISLQSSIEVDQTAEPVGSAFKHDVEVEVTVIAFNTSVVNLLDDDLKRQIVSMDYKSRHDLLHALAVW